MNLNYCLNQPIELMQHDQFLHSKLLLEVETFMNSFHLCTCELDL